MPKGERRGGGSGRAGSSKILKPVIRTAEEIEDGISSTSTVTWDPFTVLPKEIYFKIFNKLDNPMDKQNFMNAHMKWYELFKAGRNHFLFGKVFGALTAKEEETDKDLLHSRLVCRQWDQGIQSYYQLHPDHFRLGFCDDEWATDSNHLKEHQGYGYYIEFLNDQRGIQAANKLREFLASHSPNSSRSPFLTRKISVDRDVDWGYFEMNTIVGHYGHHIWHLDLSNFFELTLEIYSTIMKLLGLMPQLKTLQLDFWRRYNEHEIDIENVLQIEPPEMKKLENVHVTNFPALAFNILLEGAKAVEKVAVANKRGLNGYQLPPYLKEAALTLERFEDFEYLNALEHSQLIRKLVINTGNFIFPWPQWKIVWAIFEEKFPNLEDLHLSLPRGELEDKRRAIEQSLDCRMNLRNLKRLSVTLPNLSSLDFIQEMKGLKELKINLEHFNERFGGSQNLVGRETIQFNRDLGTMWESNIWQVFPKLRKLSIHALGMEGDRRIIEDHLYEKGGEADKMYKKEIREIPDYASSSYLRYR